MKFDSVFLEASRSLKGTRHVLEINKRMNSRSNITVLRVQRTDMAEAALATTTSCLKVFSSPHSYPSGAKLGTAEGLGTSGLRVHRRDLSELRVRPHQESRRPPFTQCAGLAFLAARFWVKCTSGGRGRLPQVAEAEAAGSGPSSSRPALTLAPPPPLGPLARPPPPLLREDADGRPRTPAHPRRTPCARPARPLRLQFRGPGARAVLPAPCSPWRPRRDSLLVPPSPYAAFLS